MAAKRQSLMLTIAALGLVLAFCYMGNAFSQVAAAVTRGPYMIAGSYDKMMIWRVDQVTGKVSYCRIDSISTDPKFMATRGPYCSAWSDN